MCANCGHLTRGMGNKGGGRLGGWWFALFKAGSGNHPPYHGWRKNRGRVPGPGRLYFSAIRNHFLKTGGYRKNRGA